METKLSKTVRQDRTGLARHPAQSTSLSGSHGSFMHFRITSSSFSCETADRWRLVEIDAGDRDQGLARSFRAYMGRRDEVGSTKGERPWADNSTARLGSEDDESLL